VYPSLSDSSTRKEDTESAGEPGSTPASSSISGLVLTGSGNPPKVYHHLPQSSCPPAESASAGSSTTPPDSLGGHVSAPEVSSPPRMLPVDDSDNSRVTKERPGGSAVKLLVSNNAAGSIIGRAGQTISELQNESGSRIKLSQSGDYYPGSQDRVCLVQGDREAVKTGLRLLLERLYMMQETMNTPAWHQYRRGTTAAVQPFDFIVRLLVPVACCGMIIGKNGTNIKYMEEASGVTSVRLSPKEDGIYAVTMERIVTINGNALQSCLGCVFLIVDGMASHPDISRYSNLTTSYVNMSMSSPVYVGSTAPPPSPADLAMSQPLLQPPSPNIVRQDFWNPSIIVPSSQQPSGVSRRSISSPNLLTVSTTPHHQQQQQQQHIHQHHRTIMQQPMLSPESAYRYGDLSDRFSMPPESFTSLQVPPPVAQAAEQPLPLLPRSSLFEGHPFDFGGMTVQGGKQSSSTLTTTVSHSASAPNLLAAHFGQSLQISPSSQQHSPHHSHHPAHQQQVSSTFTSEYHHSPTLVPQTPILIAPGCFTAQVLVPDSMIGSILGRGGRTLNELQMMSGTRIRISQRGEYMPGTRSRIVAIRGPTAEAVWDVQHMISQRMVLPPTAAYQISGSVSFDNLHQLDEHSRGLQ
jgi:predicted RNA-binding protein YlqC (UPF0109 family)